MARKRNARVKSWYDIFSKKTSYRVIVDDRRTRTNKRMIAIFNTKKEADNYTRRMK